MTKDMPKEDKRKPTLKEVKCWFEDELRHAREKFPEVKVRFGKFNRAKTIHGMCKRHKGSDESIIELSKYIVNKDRDAIVSTIKHEIAHAVAGPKVKHGKQWVDAAKALGLENPRRCTDDALLPDDKYNWFLILDNTRDIICRYINKKQPNLKNISTMYVSGKKEETIGKLRLVSAQEFLASQPVTDA